MSYKRITKGSWKYRRSVKGYDIENDEKLIAEINFRDEDALSNAKLISASKDMVDALLFTLNQLPEFVLNSEKDVKTKIETALKKADCHDS